MDTTRIIEELKRPEAYPFRVEEVGFLQTHISLLFFAGDRVYKVKKSVDLGFLDYRTLEQRRHFCEEEVRLNRRLAPDVYLGTVPITLSPEGKLGFTGNGPPLEWAVEMLRLPEQRMFSSLLERGEIDNSQMNAIVSLLVGFHEACPTGAGVDEHGAPAAVRVNVEENFRQLRALVQAAATPPVLSAPQLGFLEARGRQFLDSNHELMLRRMADGRIREGHGDLHAGNICLPDGDIVVYDCIEFSRRFRCGDVAAELAFLAMDLDERGFPGFSGYLAKRYADAAADPELLAMIGFYKGYRAVVRGKVAAMTAMDPSIDPARVGELRREAMRYLQLAVAYELPPAMILMCGLPASGKSWLAARLAAPLRASLVRSDVRRKVLSGLSPRTRVRAAYDSGLYSPEMKKRTYRSLLEGAVATLNSGHSVIVDATFSKREERVPFVDAAARLGLPYYLVHVSAPEQVTRERLTRREQDTGEASDAGLEIYERAREAFEDPSEVPRAHVVEITSGEGVPERESSVVIDRMIALTGE